jgi:hypothetical protein
MIRLLNPESTINSLFNIFPPIPQNKVPPFSDFSENLRSNEPPLKRPQPSLRVFFRLDARLHSEGVACCPDSTPPEDFLRGTALLQAISLPLSGFIHRNQSSELDPLLQPAIRAYRAKSVWSIF